MGLRKKNRKETKKINFQFFTAHFAKHKPYIFILPRRWFPVRISVGRVMSLIWNILHLLCHLPGQRFFRGHSIEKKKGLCEWQFLVQSNSEYNETGMTSRESMAGNTQPSFYLHVNRFGLLKCSNVAWYYPFSSKN